MSELSPNLEELLEIIWMLTEDLNKTLTTFEDLCFELNRTKGFTEEKTKALFENLTELDFINWQNEHFSLSEKGYTSARQLIRRHRLYERLFKDVLQMEEDKMESGACIYEHVISADVEENICTLLGHPSICPHNKPIPPGPCCERKMLTVPSIIVPVTELDIGEIGTIAYISSQKNREMDKLLGFGILPGNPIKLHQRMSRGGPVVIQIDETQIAFEKSIAEQISVRRGKKTAKKSGKNSKHE